jgi:hypothetical protein
MLTGRSSLSFIVTSISKSMNYNLLAVFSVITGPFSTLGQVKHSGRNNTNTDNPRSSMKPLLTALTPRQVLPSTYSRTGLPLLDDASDGYCMVNHGNILISLGTSGSN